MIKKVLMIRGVGVLHDAIEKPVQFSRVNIIYGENGRGKSTKSAIFASLCSGLSGIIAGRKTSGGKHTPQVAVLIENDVYEFKEGAWNSPNPSICVFDSAFVDDNVYSGLDISSDHRRNLLDFALGEKGIDLKKKVDALTQEIAIVTSEIRTQEAKLRGLCQPLSVENYLSLENDNEIDKNIEEAEKIVGIANGAKEISEKEKLSEILMIDLDISGLGTLLSKSLIEISEEVKRKVSEHIETHLEHINEKWVKEGLDLVKTNHCPFCGQSLDFARPLIETYSIYFDQTYSNYVEELFKFQQNIQGKLSDSELTKLSQKVGKNATLGEFWKRLVDVPPPTFSIDLISEKTKSARAKLSALINQKIINPMTAINAQKELEAVVGLLQEVERNFHEYNENVELLNTEIENVKSQAKKHRLDCFKEKSCGTKKAERKVRKS
ncbi:MAG: AAA family ATPase [Candidatus Manganitrophus sp.]|nr:MAG: AAA family ATPase [Candidatus Manganitrophus sp.]